MRVMEGSGPQTSVVRLKEASKRTSRPAPPSADYNLRIVWTIARWIEKHRGPDALREVVAGTGTPPADLDGKSRWISAEAFETIVARARALMPDDETFMRACVYRIKEAYGPIRYLLWATSPGVVYGQAVKTYHLVSTVGKPSIVAQDRTHFHMRIESDGRTISRLNCLMRQAQCGALPTLWGLSAAHVREDACIARGDPTCELHYDWYAGRRWLPPLLGAGLAGLVGYALLWLGIATLLTAFSSALIGGLLGFLAEIRRSDRINERTRREVMAALQQLAREEAEARNDLLQMHGRQKEWTRLVEEEMSARSDVVQKLATGVEDLHHARASTLLGFSHDLRNPLQIIQMSAQYLKEAPPVQGDADAAESVRDIVLSVDRMRRMLGDLVHVTKAQRDFVTMAPQRVDTKELTGALRRRLRALAYGSEVRTTVFATREVPDHLEIDPLALDRIIDNLLTNAVKYTDRGSIVLELDGTPGHLVLKVSDTGRGIEPDAVDLIFQAGGSSLESRRGDSFGVGLSVVVQLLDQIGGRLELMSKPGSGTTFWVYLPVDAVPRHSMPEVPAGRESTDLALSRVVRVRKVPA
jgi:signal transduction histidine kinase